MIYKVMHGFLSNSSPSVGTKIGSPLNDSEAGVTSSIWRDVLFYLPLPLLLVLTALVISIVVLILEFRVVNSTSEISDHEFLLNT